MNDQRLLLEGIGRIASELKTNKSGLNIIDLSPAGMGYSRVINARIDDASPDVVVFSKTVSDGTDPYSSISEGNPYVWELCSAFVDTSLTHKNVVEIERQFDLLCKAKSQIKSVEVVRQLENILDRGVFGPNETFSVKGTSYYLLKTGRNGVYLQVCSDDPSRIRLVRRFRMSTANERAVRMAAKDLLTRAGCPDEQVAELSGKREFGPFAHRFASLVSLPKPFATPRSAEDVVKSMMGKEMKSVAVKLPKHIFHAPQ
jgi:hypothetical protein